MAGWIGHAFDPKIGTHLLRDEDEVIVDEVTHHWVVFVGPAAEALVGLLFLGLCAVTSVQWAWLPFLIGLAVLAHAAGKALVRHMDRFVVTNMRVFRVRGVLGRRLATMPLGRILDITVEKPVLGRLLNYGHFVFESAAQEQGLHRIRHVPRPYERDLVIQRVVQRAGLRGSHLHDHRPHLR